eukprot:450083_1
MEDVYIEKILDVSAWDTLSIHVNAKAYGLEGSETGFVEFFCDSQTPLRTIFPADIDYSQCFTITTDLCTYLTLRIGGWLSGYGDHIYITRVAIDTYTYNPTIATTHPSELPTYTPSLYPSTSPSKTPTLPPTRYPSTSPTKYPTISPSKPPTNNPTIYPSYTPSSIPSTTPTGTPTKFPTASPSNNPSEYPTISPTQFPTISPSKPPTNNPTI